jgi:hypothetical protein
MYIATPPSETPLITKMREELKLINPEITILMQSEVKKIIEVKNNEFLSLSRLFGISTNLKIAANLKRNFGKFSRLLSLKPACEPVSSL